MRKLLNTSILVFAFCFCAFAQTSNTAPCPAISVTGPAGISQLNEPITFTASIGAEAKDYNVRYNWTAKGGEIIEGQETLSIKILPDNLGNSLSATLEVIGLPKDCANMFSEVIGCMLNAPSAIKIDEFLQPLAQINKNRITEIARALQNDPTAQLYIIFKHKEKTSPKMISQKERALSDSLVKAGLAADGITTVTGFRQADSVEFFLVPAGATPPKVEDN